MRIFSVHKYNADTCGNKSISIPFLYVMAKSKTEVEERFPSHVFVGFLVREIDVINLDKLPSDYELPKDISTLESYFTPARGKTMRTK